MFFPRDKLLSVLNRVWTREKFLKERCISRIDHTGRERKKEDDILRWFYPPNVFSRYFRWNFTVCLVLHALSNNVLLINSNTNTLNQLICFNSARRIQFGKVLLYIIEYDVFIGRTSQNPEVLEFHIQISEKRTAKISVNCWSAKGFGGIFYFKNSFDNEFVCYRLKRRSNWHSTLWTV